MNSEAFMWVTILTLTLAATVAGVIYLISRISKFKVWDRLPIKNRIASKVLPTILFIVVVLLLTVTLGFVNMMVVVIVLTTFLLLSQLVVTIWYKTRKIIPANQHLYYWSLALLFSAIYLGFGWYFAHHVSRTEYTVYTDKNIEPMKVVFFADSHLGTTFDGFGFAREMEKIQAENPDVVLIVGDYVDNSSVYADIVSASEALGKLKTTYGVYYCYGNHDRNFYGGKAGYTTEQLIGELTKNGVNILKDDIVTLPGGITLIGREDAGARERTAIAELMNKTDRASFTIDMNHQPNDYANEEAAGVDLVLSGHTHGGQLIPINNVGVLIGANDKTYGREKRSNTEFIVTSGISDWAIDFKTGCKAEYVVVNILKK